MVSVNKARYAAPNRQLTTAAGALAFFDERLPTTEGLRRGRTEGAHWVDLGRDKNLEIALLDRILVAFDARKAEQAGPAEEDGDSTTTAPAEPTDETPIDP
jgi:hypothetical protein